MENILSIYERVSCQDANLQKSKIFCSWNVWQSQQNSLQTFCVQLVIRITIYDRKKKENNFQFYSNSWSSKCLSKARREMLSNRFFNLFQPISWVCSLSLYVFLMKSKRWWILYGGVTLELKTKAYNGSLGTIYKKMEVLTLKVRWRSIFLC